MSLIIDAGGFGALERNDRAMWQRLKIAAAAGSLPITHGGVVAQVWRGGSGRQALLAKALQAVDVAGLDEELGRRAGQLLALSGHSDATDAAVVALAVDGDVIVTSDPDDIDALIEPTGQWIDVIPA